MHTVPYRQVLYKAARLLGLDPAVNLLDNTASALTDYINSAVFIGWRYYPWPDLLRIEERTLTGTVLAKEQSGLEPIDMLLSAWGKDPRSTSNPTPYAWMELNNTYEFGPANVPASLWVLYKTEPPVFSHEPWTQTTAYVVGDLVLGSDGNTYQAIQGNSGYNPVTSASYWKTIPFPAFLAEFSARMALADSLTEDGQNSRSEREEIKAWAKLDDHVARYAIAQYQSARFGIST